MITNVWIKFCVLFLHTVLITFLHVLQYSLKIWCSMCVGCVLYLFNQAFFFIKTIITNTFWNDGSLLGQMNILNRLDWITKLLSIWVILQFIFSTQSTSRMLSVYFMSCLLDSSFLNCLCFLPFSFHRNVCLYYWFVRPLYILSL